MESRYFVYIIENKDGRLYIGSTPSLENRLASHNHESGPDWTQGKGPWILIYTEKLATKSEALRREKKLKNLKAGQRIKQILNIMPGCA
jgi:putative endonuclease